MNDNIPEIIDTLNKLQSLYKDPQLGLFTWHDFVQINFEKLHKLYYGSATCSEVMDEHVKRSLHE